MKVAKWKVLSIAGALVLGYAASAKAVKVFEAGEDQFLELGVEVEAYYLSTREEDEQTDGIVSSLDVSVEGQVNEYIQFAADIPDGDATITFAPIPQFQNQIQITAGKTGLPFANTGSFIPVGSEISDVNPDVCDASYGLAMIHGDLLGNGFFNYQFAVVKDENVEDLSLSFRVDISPLNIMSSPPAGFNFNIGFGVVSFKKESTETIKVTVNGTDEFGKQQTVTLETEGASYDEEISGYAGDVMVEINLAERGMPFVPKIQGGYISLETKSQGTTTSSSILYIQGEFLIDKVIGIGKLAPAFQVEKFSEETYFLGAFNYYIGKKVKLSIGGKGGGDTTQFYAFSQVKF